jgi:hypothetical protein
VGSSTTAVGSSTALVGSTATTASVGAVVAAGAQPVRTMLSTRTIKTKVMMGFVTVLIKSSPY